MRTTDGTDVIASGGRDLSPAQRALTADADVLGKLPGAHAEVTALDAQIESFLDGLSREKRTLFAVGCAEWHFASYEEFVTRMSSK